MNLLKEDNLVFRPRKLIQSKAGLRPHDATEVEKLFDLVGEARESLLRIDLKSAKKKYLEIMGIYSTLKPNEQRLAYQEINDLFNERKAAERLFS